MSAYVYRFLDDNLTVLYVGITSDIEKRIKIHLAGDSNVPRQCIKDTKYIQYKRYDSDIDAEIHERFYINLYNTKYNKASKDSKKLTSILVIDQPWLLYMKVEDRDKFNKVVKKHNRQTRKRKYNCKSNNCPKFVGANLIESAKALGINIQIIKEITLSFTDVINLLKTNKDSIFSSENKGVDISVYRKGDIIYVKDNKGNLTLKLDSVQQRDLEGKYISGALAMGGILPYISFNEIINVTED